MRRKLLVGLVSACALVGVLVGPASASAAILTLNNGLGEPASEADFHSDWIEVGTHLGKFYCEEDFVLETAITKNSANPVTLSQTGANSFACKAGAAEKIYSEFTATAPMTLKPDGTGSLSISVKEVHKNNGVTVTCKRTGTLSLTKTGTSPLSFSFSGELTGASCASTTITWNGYFDSTTDEFGLPIEWVVSGPEIRNAAGGLAKEVDFWDASPTATTAAGTISCEEFDLQTKVTKNQSNPVNLATTGTSSLSGCKLSTGPTVTYSGIETTSAIALYEDSTGSLPLRLTETAKQGGSTIYTCVREGTLALDLDPATGDVSFTGTLSKVSGGAFCPKDATFSGTFTRSTDESGGDVQWIGFS